MTYLSPRSFINLTPADPQVVQRGYQPLYHMDITNRCPGCGKSHWHIGRFSAECAHCETALPLVMVTSQTFGKTA